MDIIYIFRSQSQQRSIERVFEPIIMEMKAAGHNVGVEYAISTRYLFSTLLKNIRYFSKLSNSKLCHITGDIQYVACLMNPQNTILTIHDLVPLRNKNVPWYSKFLCYWLWYYIPLRRLRRITCISESTRRDLISHFPWAKDKLTVINNPLSPTFRFIPKVFNIECPTILHIGTRTNKNLHRVIKAIAHLNCHLRVIGKIPPDEMRTLDKLRISYSNEEFVTDEQMINEYINCDIVSFPSTFEGFGMPIIEGQGIGRVVLTSNIEPMQSVAGTAAYMVDPYSIGSIKEGFQLLILDTRLRENLIKLGVQNASKYSSKNIAKLYIELYNTM